LTVKWRGLKNLRDLRKFSGARQKGEIIANGMKTNRLRFWVWFTPAFAFSVCLSLEARPAKDAEVTYASHGVRLQTTDAESATASVGDLVSAGMTIGNRENARSELTFANKVVLRLGSKTTVELRKVQVDQFFRRFYVDRVLDRIVPKDFVGNVIELSAGAVLFQIPKRASAHISSGPLNITSDNTTGLLERNGESYLKLLILSGEARVSLAHRLDESIVLKAGQILIMSPKVKELPDVAYFDIERAISTCQLISDFPPLPNEDAIANSARKQARLTNKGKYVRSNLVIFGRGTVVDVVHPAAPEDLTQKQAANSQTPR